MLRRGWATARGWRNPPASVEDRNVRHLVVQTAFAGVVNGGITTFLPVMLARMGAGPLTVSMLTAGLALTSIAMALPAGPIVDRERRLVGWSARYFMAVRVIFAVIALAAFLPDYWAPAVIVLLWAAHGIPAAIANNAWYGVLAEAISPRRRPAINGARWALLGGVTAACVALFGWLIDVIPFPLGYQLVFLVSAAAGGVGVYFYSRIEIPDREPRPRVRTPGLRQQIAAVAAPLRERGPFLHFTIATSVVRIGLYLPIGLYSLFWVNELQATDTWIGFRTTVGSIALMVGYYSWGRLTTRMGHRQTLVLASLGLAFYPALTATAPTVEWLLPAALIWGLFASGIDMSLFEGLLEVCPAERRAEFVAVNTFVANGIAFAAPILGAGLAEVLGIRWVLYAAALLHLVAVGVMMYLAARQRRSQPAPATRGDT